MHHIFCTRRSRSPLNRNDCRNHLLHTETISFNFQFLFGWFFFSRCLEMFIISGTNTVGKCVERTLTWALEWQLQSRCFDSSIKRQIGICANQWTVRKFSNTFFIWISWVESIDRMKKHPTTAASEQTWTLEISKSTYCELLFQRVQRIHTQYLRLLTHLWVRFRMGLCLD